jgi:penicillin-insensitive murein endopeptidase
MGRELVSLIERAAERVAVLPGARLTVGELSAESGGSPPAIARTRTGRDADLAFYMLDARGRPTIRMRSQLASDGRG